MNCKWHECNKPLKTNDRRRKYCHDGCRLARDQWKISRGYRVIDALLTDDQDAITLFQYELKEEVQNARKTNPAR